MCGVNILMKGIKKMNHKHIIESLAILSARFILAITILFAGLSAVSGCGAEAQQNNIHVARGKVMCVEVTQVPVRHCSWDPLGQTGRVEVRD